MAKHRAPRYVRTKKAIARGGVAAGATAVGLGVLGSGDAQAATTHDWSGVAQCESSGNWHINTGNGFFGGLQFTQSTWAAFGGTAFAPRADQATPAQQTQIAEKVLAGQGIGAWPNCGKFLKTGTTPAAAAAPAPQKPAPAPAAQKPAPQQSAPQQSAAGGNYTVVSGDTVGKIAAAHGESWQALYQRNAGVIGSNPNLIFPGQKLATSGAAPAAPAPQAGASAPAAATAPLAAPVALTAKISNGAGPVKPRTQSAANQVVTNVPGAAGITLGGTRASAVDRHGHPSGNALDYMVMSNSSLGNAIVQYNVAHWNELGVEYVIYQQKILTSPNGSWKQMEDRGGPTANHMDHVHVNYGG